MDGVDEAAGWEPGPDLFPLDPPPGLRVVLSARSRVATAMPGWRCWAGSGGLIWPGPLGLERLTVEGVADVLSNMGFPLDRLAKRVDVVSQLHRLSEGDPLLVRLYVDDLWARGGAAVRLQPEGLATIPPGLHGYFRRWWDDQQRLWRRARSPFEAGGRGIAESAGLRLGTAESGGCVAPGPTEGSADDMDAGEALRPLNRLVIGDGQHQGFAFSHPRLGAYFYEELTAY